MVYPVFTELCEYHPHTVEEEKRWNIPHCPMGGDDASR